MPVDRALAAPAVDAVVRPCSHHVANNGIFSVSNGVRSARATSVLWTLPNESMRPTVVPACVRDGSSLVGACWWRVGAACVCSGGQIRQV
jgi:hypothetical protein